MWKSTNIKRNLGLSKKKELRKYKNNYISPVVQYDFQVVQSLEFSL